MTVTDLADLFRHRREAAGLSKSEAARRNGTDRARIRNYEQGKKLQNIAAEKPSETVDMRHTLRQFAWGISWSDPASFRTDGHSMGMIRPEKTPWPLRREARS